MTDLRRTCTFLMACSPLIDREHPGYRCIRPTREWSRDMTAVATEGARS